ncbi:MAG: BMC domain-containing protein [Armatimonadetes bacterium]|nr:MAG: BMC domain-containing protein [Armatimonadota bacterium]
MSDPHRSSPAVGLWEFDSIAEGISIADAIAKNAPVAMITTGTTQPGKYLVLVAGDTASVSVALDVVSDADADTLIDSVFLPDIDPAVANAVVTGSLASPSTAEAAGIVETSSVSAAIEGADAAVKDADVNLAVLRLADGLGGKAFFVVDGSIGEVSSSVAAAEERCGTRLVGSTVIPQLTDEIRADLASSSLFRVTLTGNQGSP